MQNQLEIKHLSVYLPYGLKVIGFNTYINKDMVCELTDRNLWTHIENQSKPLLRPLSSLTEEIEHNGEKFVPINNLKHLYGWDYLWYEVLGEITNFNVNKLKYACLKLLLEWHFDVFSLIERGLALPIDGKEVER